ncbi:hypothetical protein [Mycolicibacterium gadium]|jgi:hypothetical protein|uniref:Secreted protein n=1 Tax=Mycolicibacterium gadium TaxID=1794 RepID=A0A7I7WUR5_MYCGU|nr:hypothetical protein [Mycolicibacterium gadium]BBZ21389.1 hypothetical protein MGAD_57240 [Mycolicibacterium gadium]
MKSVKVLAAVAAAVLLTLATVVAPPANAFWNYGNYDLQTNRYERASWFWFVARCGAGEPDCRYISAAPRLKFYNYYQGNAYLANGQWTLKVDVSDGLQCLPGYAMPTHETYVWDDTSLTGTITSNYDVGCFNGPPGQQFWTFRLQRL